MKTIFTDVVTPNKNVSNTTKNFILMFWLGMTFILWTFSGSRLLPSMIDIVGAFKTLFLQKNLLLELLTSTFFCLKAMLYAILISFIVAYLSVLPVFRPMCAFVAKARFLSTAGLTFIVSEI